MSDTVKQSYDDFEVFSFEDIEKIEENVINQKITAIFAQHDRKDGSKIVLFLENGKKLVVGATTGDFNSYINTCVLDKTENH